MTDCLQTLRICQGAGERWPYAFNLTDDLRRRYELDKPYTAGQAVVPRQRPGTGFEYLATTGQTNGKAEPRWEQYGATTFADGSLTWTRQELSNASLVERIQSCDWVAPSGIVASDPVETDAPGLQEVRVTLSGGTAGETYEITGTVTMISGHKYQVKIVVEVE